MRISAKADYAVRAAVELAAAHNSESVADSAVEAAAGDPAAGITAGAIATTQGIPVRFLANILSELSTAGIVSSQRGPERRYRLAKPPAEITIADVIRAVEGPLATVRGAKPEEAAYPGAAGELPRVWIAVRKNLRNVVEHVTLADVANAKLPELITELASDSEAWVTR